MGCRDDTYIWGNALYTTFTGTAIHLAGFIILLITSNYKGYQDKAKSYNSSLFFHHLLFHLLFLFSTSLMAITFSQISKLTKNIPDVVNLLQITTYSIGQGIWFSFNIDKNPSKWWQFLSIFPQLASNYDNYKIKSGSPSYLPCIY